MNENENETERERVLRLLRIQADFIEQTEGKAYIKDMGRLGHYLFVDYENPVEKRTENESENPTAKPINKEDRNVEI